jgi:hypothetical protein
MWISAVHTSALSGTSSLPSRARGALGVFNTPRIGCRAMPGQRVQVVLQADDLEALKHAARACGMPLGTYLRQAGLLRARKFNAIATPPLRPETPTFEEV